MKIAEVITEAQLVEDVTETKDLMAIAAYISNWMMSDINKNEYDGEELEIQDIQQIFNKKIPNIETYTVKWLLFKPLPERTKQPLRFVTHLADNTFDNERGSYFPAPYHSINLNLDLILKRKANPASIMLHELQHALDDLKSSGQMMANYMPASSDLQQYLKHPAEINARFAQALWDMASRYDTITKSDLLPTINKVLTANKITPAIIPDPKQYKRLVVRSYKFLDDVGQIVDNKAKPGFVQKVKNLIRKWLPK